MKKNIAKPYETGIINISDPIAIRDNLTKMDVKFKEVIFELRTDAYIDIMKPKDFPPHIEKIKFVWMESNFSDDQMQSVRYLSDEAVKKFIAAIPNIKVEIVYHLSDLITATDTRTYQEPESRAQSSTRTNKQGFRISDRYGSLDQLKELVSTSLSEVENISFGTDSKDQEYGVYDNMEICFKSRTHTGEVRMIIDQHTKQVSVKSHGNSHSAAHQHWVNQKIAEVKKKLGS